MVFYRKYRPQTISELDIVSVRDRLNAILSSKDVPHAFLFTGPRGLGKTSSARILAKAINCENRKDGSEPCNACDTCISITNGSNLDVIEIDAASNRGIDEIRELRERVKYTPSKALKKVYIIDEVHMLTNEAFNALLKTLEEPPEHVIFILCTTELVKVPETIVSRSFQVHFSFPTKEESVRSIERVLKGEKLKADSTVLEAIYKRAGGSFRDAAKIVEELSLASKDGILSPELMEEVYSFSSVNSGVDELISHLSKREITESLSVLKNFSEKGINYKTITEELLEKLRVLLIEKIRNPKDVSGFTLFELEKLIVEVAESYRRLKFVPIESLPLELVVARWGMGEEDRKTTSVVKKETDSSKKSEETLKEEKPEEKKEEVAAAPEKTSPEPVKETKKEEIKENKPNEDHGELFSSLDKNFYDALIQAVKQDNHSVAGVLRGCKLTSLSDEGVATFEAKFKFHKDKLSENSVRDIIEKRASELLNKKITLRVELAS